MFWTWLLILGWVTYYVLQRNVVPLTRAPLGVLWLVMMAPGLILAYWKVAHPQQPIPLGLVIGPFLVCPLIYWWLIRQNPRQGLDRDLSKSNDSDSVEPGADGESGAAARPSLSTALQATLDRAMEANRLTGDEEAQLRGCFSTSTYFLRKIDYRLQAIVCQGQLRGESEAVYATISENVKAQFGDRFLVLLQMDSSGQPFFALVPNPYARSGDQPKVDRLYRPVLALGLLLLTGVTTTLVGIELSGTELSKLQQLTPALWLQGLPYALSLLLILGVHEFGHFAMAWVYKLRTTLPYFIPVPTFLGTFGAFIQIRSPMPNRRALFDVGIAGPLAGFVITLPVLAWGLSLSQVVAVNPKALALTNFNALSPQVSILLSVISHLCLGAKLGLDQAIDLHPMAIAGYLGLVVTAMNLMPVGQLDGGHIVHAMFGQRVGAVIGHVARLLLLLLSIVQIELRLWALILIFMSPVDEPALDDVSELDDRRDALGLLAIAILLIIVLPMPQALARLLWAS
jgi:membrane-associated protease RseP (regulator of RpoE activity)